MITVRVNERGKFAALIDSILFETVDSANAILASKDSPYRVVEVLDQDTIILEEV